MKQVEESNRVVVIYGDITKLKVDAIVNAANSRLIGGGGVDGAIHRAAGPKLKEECMTLGGCRPGEVKITGAYNLPCRKVIHTVGPVWRGGTTNEEALLSSCYRSCLEVAARDHLQTIAFPAISTGAYGFPQQRAAEIAIQECFSFLKDNSTPEKVYLVCFSRETERIYNRILDC